jgi:uncharacterized protein
MQVLRAADRVAAPWKNGGGITREVYAWPPGAGLDDFHWRVSMAEVRADGPFSVFPGVDRVLAVLNGRLTLSVQGLGDLDLAAGAPPAVFPGDAPTVCRVVEGPVLDLNVMTRRGAACARLSLLDVNAESQIPPSGTQRLLVALDPLQVGGKGLGRLDAAILPASSRTIKLRAPHLATAWLVSFSGPKQGARPT